jgi:C-terminal processing protease CtpA/Prc
MNIHPNAIGWTLLQEMPFTPTNIKIGVREVVGLGITLDKIAKSGEYRITRVYPKSPAQRAGVFEGAVVVKIDETPLLGKEPRELMSMLAGEAGTKIHLQLRNLAGELRTIELTRSLFLTAG